MLRADDGTHLIEEIQIVFLNFSCPFLVDREEISEVSFIHKQAGEAAKAFVCHLPSVI